MWGWENVLSYFTLDIFIIRNFQICGKDCAGCFLGKYLRNELATERGRAAAWGSENTHAYTVQHLVSPCFFSNIVLKVIHAFPMACFAPINQL